MKKSTKNTLVGLLVYIVMFLAFGIYDFWKDGVLNKDLIVIFAVCIAAYVVTGFLITKFGDFDQ